MKLNSSISFNATVNKKYARRWHLLLNPLTRPARISPKKKVSWRLVKKWFNRYEKPELLKRTLVAVGNDGTKFDVQITNVRIKKELNHKRSYIYVGFPIKSKKL